MSTQSFPCLVTKNLSTFPGICFNHEDYSIPKGLKSDPMLDGVDLEKYEPVQRDINNRITSGELPMRYNVHNDIHLGLDK